VCLSESCLLPDVPVVLQDSAFWLSTPSGPLVAADTGCCDGCSCGSCCTWPSCCPAAAGAAALPLRDAPRAAAAAAAAAPDVGGAAGKHAMRPLMRNSRASARAFSSSSQAVVCASFSLAACAHHKS
jgi:hypothetical protein